MWAFPQVNFGYICSVVVLYFMSNATDFLSSVVIAFALCLL